MVASLLTSVSGKFLQSSNGGGIWFKGDGVVVYLCLGKMLWHILREVFVTQMVFQGQVRCGRIGDGYRGMVLMVVIWG